MTAISVWLLVDALLLTRKEVVIFCCSCQCWSALKFFFSYFCIATFLSILLLHSIIPFNLKWMWNNKFSIHCHAARLAGWHVIMAHLSSWIHETHFLVKVSSAFQPFLPLESWWREFLQIKMPMSLVVLMLFVQTCNPLLVWRKDLQFSLMECL